MCRKNDWPALRHLQPPANGRPPTVPHWGPSYLVRADLCCDGVLNELIKVLEKDVKMVLMNSGTIFLFYPIEAVNIPRTIRPLRYCGSRVARAMMQVGAGICRKPKTPQDAKTLRSHHHPVTH